jgi:signal transduction histidine kinase
LQLKIPRSAVIQMVAIQSDSPGVGRIVYFRDITAETEVDHLKSEFLSTAAHELRTPMASVYGFAELLMTHPLDETESRELLGIIYRQSKLMADILNELLDLARIEARRGKDFEFVQLPIQTLVQDALEGFKLPADRQGVLTSLPKENRTIIADRQKASQALVNVLSNAFKYSPQGGPVTLECIESPDASGNPRIGLRVTDTGIGMSPDQVNRIFERFYRADTSGKIPGTGLGMSIVKEIVELHAGTVTVDSAPGRGTTITLWFPAPLTG